MAQQLLWPIKEPKALAVAIALATTLPIALRRSRPILATFLGTLPWFIPTDGYVAVGYVAIFILIYSVAAYVPSWPRFIAVCVYVIAIGLTGSYLQDEEHVGEYIGAVTAVVLPGLAGRLVRHDRAQAQQLRELTAELEHERERTARMAVAEERARIARELHDVVAHSLSVIAIQADGAEAALEKDAELARRPLGAIRRSAEEALGEMRRLLGVLRAEDEGAELAPQPGLAQLEGLVERARAAGMPVTLYVDGTPRPLPASLDLSAYRIIQEALTNVHKHAHGAPATVRVVWRRELLGLQVRDTGTGRPVEVNGDGHGLVGMRERAKLHGGELRAEAHPHGGFEVVARLPL